MKWWLLLLMVVLGNSGCSSMLPSGTVSGHVFRSDYLGQTGIEINKDFRYVGEGIRRFGIHHRLAPVGQESDFVNRVFLFQNDGAEPSELAIVVTEMDNSGFLNPIENIDSGRIISRGRLKDNWNFQYLNFVSRGGDRAEAGDKTDRCHLTRWVTSLIQPRNQVRVSIVYSEVLPTSLGEDPQCSNWANEAELTPSQLGFFNGFEQRAFASYQLLK